MVLLFFFFILFYFESIFASFMQGIGKAKVTLKITIFSGIVKLLFLSILSFLEIGIYGLLIAEIINIILVVFLNYYYINITGHQPGTAYHRPQSLSPP